MKAQGVKIASERSVRKLSEETVGTDLVAVEVPLSQPLRTGVDMRLSPLVYIPDLVAKIFQLLEQNYRYIHTCTCTDMYRMHNTLKT